MLLAKTTRWAVLLGAALAFSAAATASGQASRGEPVTAAAAGKPEASAVVLDGVVAVVNNTAILASDVDLAMRQSVLEPRRRNETPDPRSTLSRLISRTLILQQIRREEAGALEPTASQVQARITELRAQLPACMQVNCTSDRGWNSFLSANRLSMADVESYIRLRLELLAFIETRFRQGVHISPEEIEAYYTKTLLPEYPKEQKAPPLDSVSARIEEILLQEQVNKLFGAWLENLRKQGDVQVLDPKLEMAGGATSQGGGNE